MDDIGTRMYKKALGGFGKIAIFFLFIGLVIFAFWMGLGYDFLCFGQSSCGNLIPYGFLVFPFIVIVVGIWLHSRWRRYQHESYHQTVRDEVLREMNAPTPNPNLSSTEQRYHTILQLVSTYQQLTLEDIATKMAMHKDDVLPLLRSLMAEKRLRQVIDPEKGAFFVLG